MYLFTRMNLQEAGWRRMDWTDLARARNRRRALGPSASIQWGKFLEELKIC
jgi:hypothetical protein